MAESRANSGATPLEGLRVAVLVAEGFEQQEMTEPRRALRDAGAEPQPLPLPKK